MKPGSAATVIALTIVVLGVTGGIAYAAYPNTSAGTTRAAAPPFRQIVGPVVKGTAPRKMSVAKCDPNETVAGGGYTIAGAFSRAKSAPKAVPVATESIPTLAQSGAGFPNAWSVVAVAPSTFIGPWTLKAYALCG